MNQTPKIQCVINPPPSFLHPYPTTIPFRLDRSFSTRAGLTIDQTAGNRGLFSRQLVPFLHLEADGS